MQEGGGHSWTGGQLCINFTMCRGGAAILQAEAIKLNNVANTSTAILRKEKKFLGVMNGCVGYARAFSLQYRVSFVDVGSRILLRT